MSKPTFTEILEALKEARSNAICDIKHDTHGDKTPDLKFDFDLLNQAIGNLECIALSKLGGSESPFFDSCITFK